MTCLVLEPRILVDVRLEVLVSQNRSHVRHVRHHRRGPGVVWHVVVADGVDHRGLGHIYLGLEGRFEKFQLIVETSLTVILGTINQVTDHKDSGHSVGIVLKSLGLELLESGLPFVRLCLLVDVHIADHTKRKDNVACVKVLCLVRRFCYDELGGVVDLPFLHCKRRIVLGVADLLSGAVVNPQGISL